MRNRDAWVIDASVALKWYLRDEQLLPEADTIRRAVTARSGFGASPHISRYEVANGLSMACRNGRLPRLDAERDLASFLDSSLASVGDPNWLLKGAAGIAMDFPVFFNDAVYMALARSLSVDFVTSDRKLYDKVASHFPFVRWLGDVPVS